jgi:hypothetical protein
MWRHRSWPSATQGQSALTRYQLFWYLNLGLHNLHHYEKQVPVALATKSVVFFLEELELTRCLWGERRDQKWGCVWGEERLNVNLLPCILCVCVCVCVCVWWDWTQGFMHVSTHFTTDFFSQLCCLVFNQCLSCFGARYLSSSECPPPFPFRFSYQDLTRHGECHFCQDLGKSH